MERLKSAAAYAFALSLCLVLGAASAAIPFFASLPACPTEDSVNCYWDAQSHGNGQGKSFVTFHFAGSNITIYTTEEN